MHGDGTNILDEVGNAYTSSGAIIDNGSLTGGPKFGIGCIKTAGSLTASANDVRFDIATRNFCFELFLYRTGSVGGWSDFCRRRCYQCRYTGNSRCNIG